MYELLETIWLFSVEVSAGVPLLQRPPGLQPVPGHGHLHPHQVPAPPLALDELHCSQLLTLLLPSQKIAGNSHPVYHKSAHGEDYYLYYRYSLVLDVLTTNTPKYWMS